MEFIPIKATRCNIDKGKSSGGAKKDLSP